MLVTNSFKLPPPGILSLYMGFCNKGYHSAGTRWCTGNVGFSSVQFSSVQYRLSVMSDSLQPYKLQHVRLLCPSLSLRACVSWCPLNWWCHPTISYSVVLFSSCLQSLPVSGSFQMSQLFASDVDTQDWSPLGWTDWISFQSKGLSRVFSNTTVQKHQFFGAQLSFTSIHDHWKDHSLD